MHLPSCRTALGAIGDSITFGWDPNLERDLTKVEENRYVGYAELVAKKNGWRMHNMACSGEASASLLRDGEEDNGCDTSRAAYDLHDSWGKHEVQMAAVQSMRSPSPAIAAPS